MKSIIFILLIHLVTSTVHTTGVYCDGNGDCSQYDRNSEFHTYCDNYYGCHQDQLVGKSITCSSDYSCAKAQFIVEDTLICNSNHSCHASSGSIDGNLKCHGSFSCSHADFILGYDGKGYFDGPNSGQNSTVRFDETNPGTNYIYGDGYYALRNGEIFSGTNNNLYVYLRGYIAGLNLNVFCEDGATCNVNCYGYGCYNTQLFCNGNNCNVYCTNTPNATAYCAIKQ